MIEINLNNYTNKPIPNLILAIHKERIKVNFEEEFENNLQYGTGEQVWKDGSSYEGECKYDQAHDKDAAEI